MKTREQLFTQLPGIDEETARVAASATYKSPKERTEEEREAIHQVSKAIAKDAKE